MIFNQLLALVLSLTVLVVNANPNGAPGSSCQTMKDKLHSKDAQTSTSPYTITIAQRSEKHEGTVHVTITSADNTPFKGYLVYAQMAGMGDVYHNVGQFTGAGENGTIIDCEGNAYFKVQNAAAHGFNNTKTSVTVDWVPNGYEGGKLFFKASIVKDSSTHWVIESETITAPESSGAVSVGGTAFSMSLIVVVAYSLNFVFNN